MSSTYIRQVGNNRRPYATWLFMAVASVLVFALIIAAPVLGPHSYSAQLIYSAFGHVCHQIPERSFFVAGQPFAVCARCTGIYAGFMLLTLAYPLMKSLRNTAVPERKWLFIAAVPLVIDVGLEFLGIWHNTHSTRLITGAILGATSVFFIMPGLLELSLREWRQAKTASPTFPLTTRVGPAPSDYSAPHRRI